MSNAKRAALMAIFAAAEQREAETLTLKAPLPWERAKRPIEVDLRVLMQRRGKKPA